MHAWDDEAIYCPILLLLVVLAQEILNGQYFNVKQRATTACVGREYEVGIRIEYHKWEHPKFIGHLTSGPILGRLMFVAWPIFNAVFGSDL